MATEIHNGQIIVDGIHQPEDAPGSVGVAPAEHSKEGSLTPDFIAELMAQCLSEAQGAGLTPMEQVNRLLTLQSPGGQKLVWTKWDVRQLFALWSQKMEGRFKV